MRLSAHDIRSLTFRKVLRGLDGEEVQAFLETVAEQVAQRDEELADLRIRLSALEQELSGYQRMETGLKDSLAVAEISGSEARETARREVELALKQAELDAARITQQARERLSALQHELLSLQDQRTSFVIRMRALVQGQLDLLEALNGIDEWTPARVTGAPAEPGADPVEQAGPVIQAPVPEPPQPAGEPAPRPPVPPVIPQAGTPGEDREDTVSAMIAPGTEDPETAAGPDEDPDHFPDGEQEAWSPHDRR